MNLIWFYKDQFKTLEQAKSIVTNLKRRSTTKITDFLTTRFFSNYHHDCDDVILKSAWALATYLYPQVLNSIRENEIIYLNAVSTFKSEALNRRRFLSIVNEIYTHNFKIKVS